MPRPIASLLLTALSATALLTAAGCTLTGANASSDASSGPDLTDAQAQATLVTQNDLGSPWAPSQGAATWRDGMLKATTGDADCRRLLDALYTEDLFGRDARVRATNTLDDGMDGAQLRYQVVTDRPDGIDRTLSWLKTLPKKCDRFTATTAGQAVQTVEVAGLPLPDAGDARQALRVTLTGETPEGDLTGLNLELAVARVGGDAIVVTNGGPADVSTDVTQAAVGIGTQRLTEVRKQGRVQV